MGNLYVKPGGGNADSDELTGILGDVLKGKTVIAHDTDGEPGLGTLELTGNANADDVLKNTTFYNTDAKKKQTGTLELTGNAVPDDVVANKTFYNTDAKKKQTGTLTDVIQDVPATASFVSGSNYYMDFPKGVHRRTNLNGAGGRTSRPLATVRKETQSATTAVDNRVVSGYTYWKDGVLRTGTLQINSVVSFSVAAIGVGSMRIAWNWPHSGPYSGVAVCAKPWVYPTNQWDSRVYTGHGSATGHGTYSYADIYNLSAGITYYFRIWVYATTNNGEMWSAGYSEATGAPSQSGEQTFTSSGIFTVPAGMTKCHVFMVNGGNGGEGGYIIPDGINYYYGGWGGAGGKTKTVWNIPVSGGQQIAVTVGAGGKGGDGGGVEAGWSSGAGGITSFGSYSVPYNINSSPPGMSTFCGGSAGGDGSEDTARGHNGKPGGSDGKGGSWPSGSQGSTTRLFEDPNSTLFSGAGGGGGDIAPNYYGGWGAGGAGGGGNGNIDAAYRAMAGGANTGGGGGGGAMWRKGRVGGPGGYGGAGIVIVRFST